MTISITTAKGQVVIPAEIREKYGIRKGSKVSIVDEGGVIILRPLMEDPIEGSRGILKGETSLLQALLKDRREEVARE